MSILPKAIYAVNSIPIKLTPETFRELEQTILKRLQDQKRPQIIKVMLKKKTKTRRITTLGFKLYCQAVIINTVRYCTNTDTRINGIEKKTHKRTHKCMAN